MPLHRGKHTLSHKRFQLSGTGRQTRRCSRQLPACFGRIAYKSNPTHQSPPLDHRAQPVPTELVCQEAPRLDYCYCATWCHCLCKTASFPAFRRFQRGDVPEPFVYSPSASSTTNHGFMPMAPRCSAKAPSKGAVTGLSYSSTQGFPRCQRFRVSPPRPVLSPVPQKPSCAAGVTLFRYVPPVGLIRLSHITRSLGHFLPSAVSRSPNFARNVCRAIRLIGSKERVALPSALRSRTSPIRGMRLQRLLVTELAFSCHCRGGAPACLSAVRVAVWRSARVLLRARAHRQAAAHASARCLRIAALHVAFSASNHFCGVLPIRV